MKGLLLPSSSPKKEGVAKQIFEMGDLINNDVPEVTSLCCMREIPPLLDFHFALL